MRLKLLLLVSICLTGCNSEPVRISSSFRDQVSICRSTVAAEFEDAEDTAAAFCARRGLLPQLASTDRCSRNSVRYDYICWSPVSR
jgi:hypothetical protein